MLHCAFVITFWNQVIAMRESKVADVLRGAREVFLKCGFEGVCIGAVPVLPEAGEIYMDAGPTRAITHVAQILKDLHETKSLNVENVQNAASQFIHLSISGVIMPRLLAVDQPVDASEHSKRAVDAFLAVYGRRNDL